MTNGDRIRAMSDDELNKKLCEVCDSPNITFSNSKHTFKDGVYYYESEYKCNKCGAIGHCAEKWRAEQ